VIKQSEIVISTVKQRKSNDEPKTVMQRRNAENDSG